MFMTKIKWDKIWHAIQAVALQLKKLGVVYYEYHEGVTKPSDTINVGMRIGNIEKDTDMYVGIMNKITLDILKSSGEDSFVFVSGDKHLIVLR